MRTDNSRSITALLGNIELRIRSDGLLELNVETVAPDALVNALNKEMPEYESTYALASIVREFKAFAVDMEDRIKRVSN